MGWWLLITIVGGNSPEITRDVPLTCYCYSTTQRGWHTSRICANV